MNTVVAKQQLCFASVQETHTISDFLGWQKEGGHSQLKLAREAAVSMCPVPEKKSYQPSAGAAVNNYTNWGHYNTETSRSLSGGTQHWCHWDRPQVSPTVKYWGCGWYPAAAAQSVATDFPTTSCLKHSTSISQPGCAPSYPECLSSSGQRPWQMQHSKDLSTIIQKSMWPLGWHYCLLSFPRPPNPNSFQWWW